jgi:hypothetical protein
MMSFDSCPRCKGDMLLERDQYGWYEQCLQCCYLHDLQTAVEAVQQPTQEEQKKELTHAA